MLRIKRLLAIRDSLLVANQVQKEFQYSDPTMVAYLAEVRRLERRFIGFMINHVHRKGNFLDNELSHLASSREPILVRVFVDSHNHPPWSQAKVKGMLYLKIEHQRQHLLRQHLL